MANSKISQLIELSESDGTEYAEVIVSPYNAGTNRKIITNKLGGVTRAFNRTFVETLIFDKHEIFHAPVVMSSDITLEIGSGGLVDQASAMRFRLTTDGVSAINFGSGFDFLYGITSGQVLDAGTYEVYLLYTNGSVSVSVPGVTAEQSSATTLSSPSDFAAVADGQTALDLSWTNVTNNEGYLIEFSLDGSTNWTTLETTAVDAVASTQTSLSAGDIRYYRIKTLGDEVLTLDSAYSSVISGQTESAGDITDPVPTFFPANGNTTWTVNRQLTITMDEPIRNTNATEITNANVAALITLKQTNSGGANIAFTATINSAKQVITIHPTTIYGVNQLVYLAINNFEDVNGNDVTSPVSITFTTTEYTYFNGTSSYVRFGNILNSLWTLNDTKFKLRITINNQTLSGTRFLSGKYSTGDNQRMFYWYYTDTDVFFAWCSHNGVGVNRGIKWAGALTAGEHELELVYDGSLDTNNGLDRGTLNIDGVAAGSKTLATVGVEALSTIFATDAQLSIGTGVNNAGTAAFALYYSGEAKDYQVLSGVGDTVEIDVPVLKSGTDNSGNARNGTWVQ
jgi:hypothetical protein